MSLLGLLPQSVTLTLLTPGTDDAFGNPTQDELTVTEPGRLEQIRTTEQVGGRDVTVTQTVLFLNPDSVITSTARVAVDGRSFEVDGQPNVVYGATSPHHIEAPLRETTA